MNVIEKYAQQLSELRLEENLFLPDGKQICPAEGTRKLIENVTGMQTWFEHVNKMSIHQIICKNWLDDGVNELQGVIIMDAFYKVKQGEAKVSAVQVLHARENKIVYMNSFWDLSKFKKLIAEHPELEKVFGS